MRKLDAIRAAPTGRGVPPQNNGEAMTDDEAIELRPARHPADAARAHETMRAFRRIWATAVAQHGRSWADKLQVVFGDDTTRPKLLHPTATPAELHVLGRAMEGDR